ncbi:hypothetical protein ACLUXA_07110 [Limosilactobacillus mucosae]|nr:hypothetical protein [Limosilactobacillus mucosae]
MRTVQQMVVCQQLTVHETVGCFYLGVIFMESDISDIKKPSCRNTILQIKNTGGWLWKTQQNE